MGEPRNDAIRGDAGREYVRLEGTDFVVWTERREYWMNFRVVAIVAWDMEGNPTDYGHGMDDMKPTPDEATPTVEGSIKWDGCSDLNIGEGDGYLHLCGGRDWAQFVRLLEHLWREARKIPEWDPDAAAADAFPDAASRVTPKSNP